MKSLLKIISLFFIAALVTGCGEEKVKEKYVVKVGNSVLTEAELSSVMTSPKNIKYRQEYIREWIDNEVLYREAVSLNLEQSDEYLKIIEATRKKLAGTLALNYYVEQNFVNPGYYDLRKYFEEHADEYRLNEKVYVINLAVISGEEKALEFRNYIVEYDWGIAENHFTGDDAVKKMYNEKSFYEYQLMPAELNKIVQTLPEGEPSILLELEPGVYTVVEVVKTYSAGEIPEFDYVRENVMEKYSMVLKKELVAEYMEKLYSRYNIEINREN